MGPGALPTVEMGAFQYDLSRRDFTINCMAIILNTPYFGVLLDLFNGKEDLDNKNLKVLHSLSFIEDPTRIIRLARFYARFGYTVEEETKALATSAIYSGFMSRIAADRLRNELEILFGEDGFYDAVLLLEELGFFEKHFKGHVSRRACLLQEMPKGLHLIYYFAVLLYGEKDEDIVENLKKIKISDHRIARTLQVMDHLKKHQRLLAENVSAADIYDYFVFFKEEELILFDYLMDDPLKALKDRYQKDLSLTMIHTDGNQLKTLGLSPGPHYKEILDRLLRDKLNGVFSTIEEEEAWLQKILKEGYLRE